MHPGGIFSSLLTAEAMAKKLGMSPDRLVALAEDGFCPHYTVDGEGPLFGPAETKEWAQHNLLKHHTGRAIKINMTVVMSEADLEPAVGPPESIRNICGLKSLPKLMYPPGVYFLCRGGEVAYVGQSVNVSARVAEHNRLGKSFDAVYYVPVPRESLDTVEGALIRFLRPVDNGTPGPVPRLEIDEVLKMLNKPQETEDGAETV